MKRSQEIHNAIRLKEQAKVIVGIENRNRISEIDRQIALLNAELKAIKSGKMPDEVITL